ncbi:MAG: SRPBCC domain-containing protein [Myxococcales bacterium]|nr:SRPBCC domain-containing protein [Myxococcales bacterium]
MFNPHVPVRSHVVVRQPLPAPPERVFALFTTSIGLQSWFCDEAVSDPVVNGEVHASWHDEDGEQWARVGRWVELTPPCVAVVEWYAVQTGTAADEQPQASDYWRIAIAPADGASMVTVVSPILTSEVAMRAEVLSDAAKTGWEQTFSALRALLTEQGDDQ